MSTSSHFTPEDQYRDDSRELQPSVNKQLRFSDPELAIGIDVNSEGRITVFCKTKLDVSPPEDDPARSDFWEQRLPELRSLAETAEQAKVRMAARAVLRFAEGKSMSMAAEPTPHRAGWIRGLRECVRQNGVSGLKHRNYRPPRPTGE